MVRRKQVGRITVNVDGQTRRLSSRISKVRSNTKTNQSTRKVEKKATRNSKRDSHVKKEQKHLTPTKSSTDGIQSIQPSDEVTTASILLEMKSKTENGKLPTITNCISQDKSQIKNVLKTSNLKVCDVLKVMFWKIPFLPLLDSIIYNRSTSFHELLESVVFDEKTLPLLDGKSRTTRYGIIDDTVGKILLKFGSYLNMNVESKDNVAKNKSAFRKAKYDLQSLYYSMVNTLTNVRKCIGSTPSLFWYLPAIYLFPIIAHLKEIFGELEADKVDEQVEEILKKSLQMDDSEYRYPDVSNFLKYLKKGAPDLDVEALFTFIESENMPSNERKNSCFTQMRQGLEFKLPNIDGFVPMFPFMEFYPILLDYKQYVHAELVVDVINKLNIMKAEWSIATEISSSNINNIIHTHSLYGYHDNSNTYLRPWENIYQISTFLKQINSVMDHELSADASPQVENETYRKKFNSLLNHFLSGILLVEKPIMLENLKLYESTILHNLFVG